MGHAVDEPFGDLVEDIRAGIGPATAINMNRVPTPGIDDKPVDALDFYGWHKKPPPPEPEVLPPEVLAERLRAFLNSKAGHGE